MVRVWCGTTPHVRRLSCGRSILYDSCVVTLNFACLPAFRRLFSRGPSEPDSTASEAILSSLYADSGGGVKKPSNGSALCAQELTLAAWNETNAPFVNKKCIVKLVRILCTEAGHPFIFIAKMPWGQLTIMYPLLCMSLSRVDREPTIG